VHLTALSELGYDLFDFGALLKIKQNMERAAIFKISHAPDELNEVLPDPQKTIIGEGD
jgi:hypothetical protein